MPTHNSRHIISSLKTKSDASRTFFQRTADFMTKAFGSMWFLILNIIWFGGWIIWNVGFIKGLEPFDPYPFGFLTVVVSLEAIILATVVLISQNRAGQIADLREEIDLQVDIITEQELTKVAQMISLLLEKNGISMKGDKELEEMLKPTNLEKIQKRLAKEVIE